MFVNLFALQNMVLAYNYVFVTFANCHQVRSELLLNFLCSMEVNGLLSQTIVVTLDDPSRQFMQDYLPSVNIFYNEHFKVQTTALRNSERSTAAYRKFLQYKEYIVFKMLEENKKLKDIKYVVLDNDITMAKNPIKHLEVITANSNCNIYSMGDGEKYLTHPSSLHYIFNAGFLVIRNVESSRQFYRKLILRVGMTGPPGEKEQPAMRIIAKYEESNGKFEMYEPRTYHQSFWSNSKPKQHKTNRWCLLPSTHFPSFQAIFRFNHQ